MAQTNEDEQSIVVQLPREILAVIKRYADERNQTIEDYLTQLITKRIEDVERIKVDLERLENWVFPKLIEVHQITDYRLHVTFADGTEGNFDVPDLFSKEKVILHYPI